MPGPGGSGGGGGRGGSFGGGGGHSGGGHGGSHGGGGFHGGPHPGGHPGGFHSGWYVHPRWRGAGGCCGGLAVLPILVLVIVFAVIYNLIPDTMTTVDYYDEEVFQDYADQQYSAVFGDSDCYEDNILLVFLAEEDHYSFCYIAWVGDHVDRSIAAMMDDDDVLGNAMYSCINDTNYKYSLDSDLAAVVDALTEAVSTLDLEGCLSCGTSHTDRDVQLVDHTQLSLTAATVEDALTSFYEATGIPIAIVVEDMADVFDTQTERGKSGNDLSIVAVLAVVALIVVAVYVLRKRKYEGDTQQEKNRDYGKFDDQYK